MPSLLQRHLRRRYDGDGAVSISEWPVFSDSGTASPCHISRLESLPWQAVEGSRRSKPSSMQWSSYIVRETTLFVWAGLLYLETKARDKPGFVPSFSHRGFA
jgi:hypothetical protein